MDYVAEKLGHPSAEVRGRALESLEFKWKYGLIRAEDLLQDRRVLRGLIGLLGLGDGPQTTAVALLLLRKMAAADGRLARGLLEVGALQQLQATTIRTTADAEPLIWIQPGIWPEELLPSVEALARLLLGFQPSSGTTSAQQQSTAGQQASNAAAAAAAAGEQAAGGGSPGSPHVQQQLLQAGALRRSVASAVSAGLGSDAAGSPPLARTHLSSGSLVSAGGASPSGAAALTGTARSTAAAGVRSVLGHNMGADSPSAGSYSAGAAAGAGAGAAAGASRSPDLHGVYRGPGSAAASGDTSLFDERLLRARARADWRQMEAAEAQAGAGVPLYAGDSSVPSGPPAGHLTLPVVSLSAADDQALFELNVRLQYSDDERLLLPALLELSGAVGLDLPAEALLLRPSILDNCLALVGSSKASRAVQQAAAAALLQLTRGLQQSLAAVTDPELCRSEYGDAAAAAAEAAATGKPVPLDLTSCLNLQGPTAAAAAGSGPLAGFKEAAKALAAAHAPMLDPSCPNSYPQLPLPELCPDTVWRLPAGALQGAVVDVTAAVPSICLQTVELLNQPERHYELLPLLEEALPLLAAPLRHLQPSSSNASQPAGMHHQQQQQQLWQQQRLQLTGDQRQQLQQHLQAVWRGLLAALSRALAACSAVGAADRAAAASASLAGGSGSSVLTAAVAAVVAAVPPAAAAGAAALAAGGGGDGGLCVWDPPTLNLLMLALRWANVVPTSWLTPSLVPASLADTLAAAACDEALDLLLPQLRQGARPLLQQLRPGALQALREAHAVPAAWDAGESAREQLQTLQQQLDQHTTQQQQQHTEAVQSAVAGWLNKLQDAFPGLGYAPRWDAKLLQAALQGLSLVAAAAGGANGAGPATAAADAADRAAGVMVALLRHHSPTVQQLVWQLLQSAVAAAAGPSSSSSVGATDRPVLHLLLLPRVLECLVVEQLSSQDSKPAACTLLMALLQHGGSSVAQQLLPWRPWVSSCAGDTAGDALNEALAAFLAQCLGRQPGQGSGEAGLWAGRLAVVLQDLFSSRGDVRRAAGRQLLLLMLDGAELPPEDLEDVTDDPFKGLLGTTAAAAGSTAASAAAGGGGSSSSSRFLLPPDPLTDASASLAAAFSRQDVLNLLAVLANKGLAQELRRSAAEELLALAPDPHLLAVMAQQAHLDAIWQLCVPPESEEEAEAGGDPLRGLGLSGLAVGAGDPSGSIFDMQLPIAGLHLLAGLLARSPQALDWVTQQPDRLLQPLLPLVLHSLNSVRKAVGRVLALVVFGHAAQQWRGFALAASAATTEAGHAAYQPRGQRLPLLPPGAGGVLLPLPFCRQYKFPFKVTWLPVEAEADQGPGCDTAAAGQGVPAGAAAEPDEMLLVPEQHRQQHQQRQRGLVRQLVEQQQILRAADAAAAAEGSGDGGSSSGVAAAARRLLSDCLPVELSHISQRVMATTAATLVLDDPAAVAARCLAAVAAAGSHDECTHALTTLEQQLGGTSWGLLAVLQNPNPGWLQALSRLLGTAPVTREDQSLWLMVLQLLERLLLAAGSAGGGGAGSSCSVAVYTQLQLLLQRSLSVWLQQPAAAAVAPRPPLALAAGSSGWEAMRAQPSSAAAAAVVADALSLGGSSAPATAAVAAGVGASDRALAVRVSRQALSTLLVLVRAVKRDCSPAVGFYQHHQQQQQQDSNSSSSSVAAVACYSLSALKPCDLIRLLCECVVGVTEGVDYSCRVLASGVLCEVLAALQDVARTQPPPTPTTASAAAAVSSGSVPAAAGRTAGAAGQTAGAAVQPVAVAGPAVLEAPAGVSAAVLGLLEAWICRVLMPAAGRQLPGFTGKALVRCSLQGLCCVVQGPLVSDQDWTQTWADIGGTFWLSRLCRDREASIRVQALRLTAQLLHPGRTATQALVTANWPDCVHRLTRVSSDLVEAHGVRAAALRGLAAAMVLSLESLQPQQQEEQQQVPALPTSPPGQQQQEGNGGQAGNNRPEGRAGAPEGEAAGTSEGAGVDVGVGAAPHTQVHTAPSRVRKLHGFGLAPLLQAEAVWQQLLPQLLLKWQQQPPTLTAAAAVLAAVAAAAEPDGVGRKLLLTPGLAAAAVAVAAAGADGSSVSQGQGGAPPIEPQSVTAVLQQQSDRLDAAAAALQLLALVSAPASSGGGLLPLPASTQAVVVAGPAAAVRLMCSIGSSLQAQQEAVSHLQTHSSASGGDAGALLRLQQQQLTAFRVAAAALTATRGAWPEAARRQQLLPLLQAQASGGSGSSSSNSSSQGAAVGRPGELLCAIAVVLAHPACSPAVRLTCTQLIGLLLSDPQLAAAALGSPAAAEAVVEGDAGLGGAATTVDASAGASDKAVTEPVLSCGGSGGSSSSGGEAVGAVLCRDLAGQLPSSIFLPSTAAADSAAQGSTGAAAAAAAGAGSVSGLMGSTPAWAAAAAAESPGQLMVAPPDGLVVVFALQNLLAFSCPAKAAALSIGLHRLLMEAALSMAAAVAGPAAGAAAAGSSGAAAARRTRARWFNTPNAAPAQPTGGAGAASGAAVLGAGPSRKGNSGSVAFGRGGAPPDLPGFTAVAGVKRPSASAAAGAVGSAGAPPSGKGKGAPAGSSTSRRGSLSLRSSSALKAKQRQQEQEQVQQEEEHAPQQQPPQQAEQPAAGEAGEHQQAPRVQPEQQQQQQQGDQQSTQHEQQAPAGVPSADDASQHVSLLQQQLRQQQERSSDRQQPLTGSPGAGGTSSGAGTGLSKQQLQAACKQLNLRKLLMSVVLLRHLAHGCEDTQAVLTADGLVEVVLQLWPLALQHTPLLLELTRLLANSLPSCYEARLAAASLTGPPVSPVCAGTALSCLASLLVGQPLTPQLQQGPAAAAAAGSSGGGGGAFAAAAGTAAVVRAAAVVLLGYGSTDDGAATLVKAGASCLPELAKAVRACIVSAQREVESQQQRALNSDRLAAVLQLLAVLAGRSVGQAAMLRPTVAPVLLELCAEVLQLPQQPAALPAALLLLRNLSFNAEVRSPLLANAALLPLLLAAAESLLAVLPAAERQQWQQRLTAADAELSAAAAELGCDCKPPKWDPMYETLGPGGGAVAGSGGGVGSAAGGGAGAATKLLAAGRSSRPGSPLVLVGAGGAAVPSAAGSVCCAVYAVSALWALVHNGEKVKAALRKLPAAAARLGVVRGYAGQLLLQQQLQQTVPAVAVRGTEGDAPGGSALVVAAAGGADVRKPGQGQWGSRLGPQRALQQQEQEHAVIATAKGASGGAAGGRGTVWLGAAGLCGQQGANWWLEQLRDSCSALLDLMDAC